MTTTVDKALLNLTAPLTADWQFKPNCPGPDSTNVRPEIEAFLRASGMDPAVFGLKAMHDPQFVNNLRWGQQCRAGSAERARLFMRDYDGGRFYEGEAV